MRPPGPRPRYCAGCKSEAQRALNAGRVRRHRAQHAPPWWEKPKRGRPSGTALDDWDHVVECSLTVASGRILLTSTAPFGLEGPTIVVTPGTYRALVYFGALDSVPMDDDMVGDEHYRVVLWPDSPVPPQVLKRKPLP